VEEWINSGKPFHILRDHSNHCYPVNGGMWGTVKGIFPDLKDKIMNWKSRDSYWEDMYFLRDIAWPVIVNKHIAHDVYCCQKYPNTKPFPTKRFLSNEHVGQVYDENDTVVGDYKKGFPIPPACRKEPTWQFG
jgi:hypothetical protein